MAMKTALRDQDNDKNKDDTIRARARSGRQAAYSGDLGVPDREQLLSDDRQHFNVDPVELVEAAPGTRLSKSGEETTHHLQRGKHRERSTPIRGKRFDKESPRRRRRRERRREERRRTIYRAIERRASCAK